MCLLTGDCVNLSAMDAAWKRMLPPITDLNRPFWTGGATGSLMIARCVDCDRWVDPPAAGCSVCGGALKYEAVSGRGTVYTFTVNRHQYHPDVPPPTVIAIVQLEEQDDLRIVSNIVECDPADVRCGLPVKVAFEPQGEVFYPVFEPALP
jgi:uncharacterized OB-fold protein